MQHKNRPIPAVVDDMLKKLWNSYIDQAERDNVALMLEEIERAIKTDVGVYRRERTKDYSEDREHKRKDRAAARNMRVSSNNNLGKY